MFRPLQDRILVKRLDAEMKSPGGILIPDTAKTKPHRGEVIAVGPGRIDHGKARPVDCRVGDQVVFSQYAGTDIKLADVDHTIIREEDILGILSAKSKK